MRRCEMGEGALSSHIFHSLALFPFLCAALLALKSICSLLAFDARDVSLRVIGSAASAVVIELRKHATYCN